ncbi:LuxR family transcriptional regulator [Aureimonas populi]|uniref:LuxR family transcriptional regulator n=1 Tax=Aureimonas populi TaxID=1701758 RepID=A0ABW5CRD2_9HYPH|nr:LuxR family transcriptional regulator [Aureimonas populi]
MSAAFDILGQIERPWSELALASCLEELASAYGFSHVAIVTIPSSDEAGSELKLLMTNWPEEFRQGFERLGLGRFSPVLRALKADPAPFIWDVETLHGYDPAEPGEASAQARLLIAAGCVAGAYFPVHGLTNFNGALFLAGARPPLCEAQAHELHLAAFAIFGILAAARFEENKRNNPLSQRERDCLKLAMLGKTSSEIGTILKLSEYTISQHLASATRKVNASNRTHAVALAAQLGYLS